MEEQKRIYPDNFVTKRVQNFLRNKIDMLNFEHGQLLQLGKGGSQKNALENETFVLNSLRVIENKLTNFKKKINLPVIPIEEQKETFLVGNGGKIKMHGEEKYIILDCICIEKRDLPSKLKISFISANSPFGKALIGKKVNEPGEYVAHNQTYTFEVLRIDPPSKINWIYEGTNAIIKQKDRESVVMQ
ncbi:MAG: GreA/GreB family elongation factor [Minisyncoccia bacterium]